MLVFFTHFVYVLEGLGAVTKCGKTRNQCQTREKLDNWRQARGNLKASR